MMSAGQAQPQVWWLLGWGWFPAGGWRLMPVGSLPLPGALIVWCSRTRQRARR
jgi:hypothetical protein